MPQNVSQDILCQHRDGTNVGIPSTILSFYGNSHHVPPRGATHREPHQAVNPHMPSYQQKPTQPCKSYRPSTPSSTNLTMPQKPWCEATQKECHTSRSRASTAVPSTTWDGSQHASRRVPSAQSCGLQDSTADTTLCSTTPDVSTRHQQCFVKPSVDDTVIWPRTENTSSSCVLSSSRCEVVPRRKSTVRVSAFRIEGGYIITPGNHRVLINRCVMDADQAIQLNRAALLPAAAALASYAHDMYSKWRLLEEQMDSRTFQLSFRPRTDLERFRQMALQCILQYVGNAGLSCSTSHCSIHNVHRVLLHYVEQKKVRLTANMFFGTLAACLRMALKHEETPEMLRPFRESPDAVWKRLGLGDGTLFNVNTTYVNTIEVDCLTILKDPLTPPSAPDYLDRYLTVGGWPAHVVPTYRELALYLTNLSLFSRTETDQLAGIPPSLMAACALSLAIKVISAGREDGYEFWPQRLVVYSGYSIDDLRVGIRGLSVLLRRKPTGSDILHRFHPVWARYTWR